METEFYNGDITVDMDDALWNSIADLIQEEESCWNSSNSDVDDNTDWCLSDLEDEVVFRLCKLFFYWSST